MSQTFLSWSPPQRALTPYSRSVPKQQNSPLLAPKPLCARPRYYPNDCNLHCIIEPLFGEAAEELDNILIRCGLQLSTPQQQQQQHEERCKTQPIPCPSSNNGSETSLLLSPPKITPPLRCFNPLQFNFSPCEDRRKTQPIPCPSSSSNNAENSALILSPPFFA